LGVQTPVRAEVRVHHAGGTADAAVGDNDVRSAVVIEVLHRGAEPGAAPARAGQANRCRAVHEEAARLLYPERVRLLGQVRDEQAEAAVAVDVTEGHPHARLRLPNPIVGDTVPDRLILEGLAVLVDPEAVGLAVVGDKNVGPAVAVEVRAQHAQSWSSELRFAHSAFQRHVLEANPLLRADIAEQSAHAPGEDLRGTVFRLAAGGARPGWVV